MKYLAPALAIAAAFFTMVDSQRLNRNLPEHVDDSPTDAPEPKYPADPPMDDDYVHDDLQPLDAFVWTTPAATTSTTTAGYVVEATDEITCRTSGPRKASWFSHTAAEGTPCVFGVDQRDEGGYCIHDDPAAHGPNGWCWTKMDRSEWGTCNDACPLTGQDKVLLKSIQKTGASLKTLMATLAKQLGNDAVASAAASGGSTPSANPSSLVANMQSLASLVPHATEQLAAVQAAPGIPAAPVRQTGIPPGQAPLVTNQVGFPPVIQPSAVIAAAAGAAQGPPATLGAVPLAPFVQAPPPALAQATQPFGQPSAPQAKKDLKSLLVDFVASQGH